MEISSNKKVLMFHEVLDDKNKRSGFHLYPDNPYSIFVHEFENIVKTYRDSVYYSFDDGGISNLVSASILEKYNLRGIFFIPTSFIGKEGFLSKKELEKLSKKHTIHSHGHSHLMHETNLQKLSFDYSKSLEVLSEFTDIKNIALCLPGGTISRNHIKAIKKSGVKIIYHSAPSNILLYLFYGKEVQFVPRVIIKSRQNLYLPFLKELKSYLKQIFYYVKRPN